MIQTRRRFLTTLSVAAAGLISRRRAFAAEGPLETTTVRIANRHSLCNAPQLVAEELLRVEGFTEARYVETAAPATARAIAESKVDFSMAHASYWIPAIDAGEPVVLLAGIHVGCFELFAREGIHSVGDLKGRSVGVSAPGR
jgi:NitT/TauT family transport system substrate-binding protein